MPFPAGDSFYDSLPPQKTAIFFSEPFMAVRHKEGYHEKIIITCFFLCKGPSNDDVGVAGGTVLQEIRSGAGFKTSDFVTDGGATVERLRARKKNLKAGEAPTAPHEPRGFEITIHIDRLPTIEVVDEGGSRSRANLNTVLGKLPRGPNCKGA